MACCAGQGPLISHFCCCQHFCRQQGMQGTASEPSCSSRHHTELRAYTLPCFCSCRTRRGRRSAQAAPRRGHSMARRQLQGSPSAAMVLRRKQATAAIMSQQEAAKQVGWASALRPTPEFAHGVPASRREPGSQMHSRHPAAPQSHLVTLRRRLRLMRTVAHTLCQHWGLLKA